MGIKNEVKEQTGVLVYLLWGLVLLAIAAFALNELGFRIFQLNAPRTEQVRRETFEQSRSFREGTVRDLENLYLEYSRSNNAGKVAIRDVARHRMVDVPEELMTANLRRFKAELENN